MLNQNNILEVIGWLGTIMILAAYALSSLSYIDIKTKTYQYLNLFGALGLTLISFYKGVYQPAVLNLIWAIIALIGLFKK